jgi:hypothetical protein
VPASWGWRFGKDGGLGGIHSSNAPSSIVLAPSTPYSFKLPSLHAANLSQGEASCFARFVIARVQSSVECRSPRPRQARSAVETRFLLLLPRQTSHRATPTGPYCVLTCALMDPTTLGSGVSWSSSTCGSRLHHVLSHDCRNRVKTLSNAADSLGLQSNKGSGKRSAWLMRVLMAVDGEGNFASSCLTDSPLALSPLQPAEHYCGRLCC